ncbi:hypothetical protein OSTOST_11476 [Ostertagia ostertagi]
MLIAYRIHNVAFLEACSLKLRMAIVEPGTAVGAIAVTSTGESSLQLTLRTEIGSRDEGLARQLKMLVDVTTLDEICDYIEEVNMPDKHIPAAETDFEASSYSSLGGT